MSKNVNSYHSPWSLPLIKKVRKPINGQKITNEKMQPYMMKTLKELNFQKQVPAKKFVVH